MSELTAKQQSFIEMMKKDDELALKGFQFLLKRDDFSNFFDSLDNAGFFAPDTNPAPVSGERENTIRIPYWPPLGYLTAVAKHAGTHGDIVLADKILKVVRDASAWRDAKGQYRHNYRTNLGFAEILSLVPTKAVQLGDMDLFSQWFDDPYDRMLIADSMNRGVLPRLLGSDAPQDWQKAARGFFHATAVIRQEKADGREPEFNSVVDDFWLGELIKNHAKQIGRRVGEKAVDFMLTRVREVFGIGMRRDQSSVFRPAVEDDAQNYQWRSAENRVVDGLRDVVMGWADESPESARLLVRRMLEDELEIIRRIGVYVLGEHWFNFQVLYTERLARALLHGGHMHELYRLLQHHFANMNPEQKRATLDAIEKLPEVAYGDDPEHLRRYNQYRWLSAINGKGSAIADQRFKEFETDPAVGKLSEHPDFDSYITSWVGPGATPYSPEELIAVTKDNALVEKLNAFVRRDDWQGPTIEGLTTAIGAAVETNPEVFLENLSQVLAVRPTYQSAVIEGLRRAWEANAKANWGRGWERLVGFFEQLVKNERFWGQADDTRQHWVVTAVADCLKAGTKQDDHAYDPALLPRTQFVLAELLKREPGVTVPSDDAMFEAMNTPKGRVIEALYSQALRAARISDQTDKAHKKSWEEIKPLFESELALCKNSNFEFSTLTANYLPQLQYLDNKWVDQHVEQVFPTEYEANTVCAFDGLAYASFTKQLYELVAAHGVVQRGMGLKLKGRGAREKLLERIAAAYLWGIEPLDGDTITRLFETASGSDMSVVIRVFWLARNGNLTPEQRERILSFWERTLHWSEHHQDVSARTLSTSSLLATHIAKIEQRERNLLKAVAPHVHVGHETYEFVAELLRLAQLEPATIAEVLQSMVNAHPPDYDYQDRLASLLKFLAEHGQKDRVILISNKLRYLEGAQALYKSLTAQ
jgi:hypothetical protein